MAGQYGEFVINLRRNNLNTPWGFRLQGGKEFNTYLSIQRVFNGSPADGHLQRGDVIVAVDNEDVSQWYQKQAYDGIQSIGLTLGLVVRRGGTDPDARPTPPPQSQAQPVASFVRKPFGQQQAPPQHHPYQQQQQQQLSPQMTSKATLNFQQPSQPYAPAPSSHYSTDNIGGTAAAPSSSSYSGVAPPWTQQQQHSPVPNQNSFSTPFQVRTVQPPPQKAYSSYSPQPSDSFVSGKAPHYAETSQAPPYQQDQSGAAGRAPFGRDSYQRDAAQSSQQPSYNEDSNHVTYDRNQSAAEGAARESRHEPAYNEGRQVEDGEEGEDYQALSVRDIKQMFNKPDQKDVRVPVSRIKRSPVAWTKPAAETSSSGPYGAPGGPRPGQHSSLSPIRPGSIQRCPAVSDDFRKSFSPPAQPNYGQPRFASPPGVGKPAANLNINKQGGAYAGIIQPALPPKTTPTAAKPGQKGPQKKKDFDPNQSAVYKILLEEEERAKIHPNQQEEEEEEAPRRQAQGPKQGQRKAQPQGQRQPQKQQGSRLDELLDRDAAQLAPYKEEQRHQQEQRASYQEQRSPYQEPKAPYQEQRPAYQEPKAPYQEQRPAYQEPRSPYQEQRPAYLEPKASYQQEQRMPYQEPRAPTYQEPGSSQSHRHEVHQPHSPARGAPGAWQGASSPYGSQDHNSSFLQTQYVDGIPTSDF